MRLYMQYDFNLECRMIVSNERVVRPCVDLFSVFCSLSLFNLIVKNVDVVDGLLMMIYFPCNIVLVQVS